MRITLIIMLFLTSILLMGCIETTKMFNPSGWVSDGSNTNTSGNATAENIFIPQYIFPHTNETIPLTGANEWTNVTFGEEVTDLKFGIAHTHNDRTNTTFTIRDDGIYFSNYDYDIIDTSAAASDIDVAGRMVYANNESEIIGSIFETDVIKQQVESELTHNFLVNLFAGDQVMFQFIATDADVKISDHSTFGEHPVSASIIINKIANIK